MPNTSSGPSSHTQYFHTPDDEIDFSVFLRQPLAPARPRGVRWKAHWLAVEGVQPAIPENPAPAGSASASASASGGVAAGSGVGSGSGAGRSDRPSASTSSGGAAVATGPAALRPSAKQVLPQELQLYLSNLTAALVPDPEGWRALAFAPSGSGSGATPTPVNGNGGAVGTDELERHRLAALASLRSDPAVGGVLVYLVRWLNESITKSLAVPLDVPGSGVGAGQGQGGAQGKGAEQLRVVGWLLDGVGAVLDNTEVFLEPYVSLAPAGPDTLVLLHEALRME